jgi:hypothetical protein
MRKISALLAFVAFVSRPAHAEPGFAEPPGGQVLVAPDAPPPREEPEPEQPVESSIVRVSVGPGLRVSEAATDGGLTAALDAGSGPVGARLSGTWVRVGSENGLSQYQADLWVDFGAGRRLHPIVGAGAAVARLNHASADGSFDASTYGVGVLRGTLEYVLPVAQADARAGVDLVGSVPVIHGEGAPEPGPWLLLVARVGVGF